MFILLLAPWVIVGLSVSDIPFCMVPCSGRVSYAQSSFSVGFPLDNILTPTCI